MLPESAIEGSCHGLESAENLYFWEEPIIVLGLESLCNSDRLLSPTMLCQVNPNPTEVTNVLVRGIYWNAGNGCAAADIPKHTESMQTDRPISTD